MCPTMLAVVSEELAVDAALPPGITSPGFGVKSQVEVEGFSCPGCSFVVGLVIFLLMFYLLQVKNILLCCFFICALV